MAQRQLKPDQQPGAIVREHQLAMVQVRDRFSQCQAKACSFVRSARIEPSEPAPGFAPKVFRNAGAAVGDLDCRMLASLADANRDLAA